MKLWKSPAFYFGILLILLVGGALAAPYIVDWSLYRSDIEKFGTKLTGRSVTVEGPISVRLFPWPKLSVGKVRVAMGLGGRFMVWNGKQGKDEFSIACRTRKQAEEVAKIINSKQHGGEIEVLSG